MRAGIHPIKGNRTAMNFTVRFALLPPSALSVKTELENPGKGHILQDIQNKRCIATSGEVALCSVLIYDCSKTERKDILQTAHLLSAANGYLRTRSADCRYMPVAERSGWTER